MQREAEPLDRIDEALRGPVWQPPPGFAPRVVAAAVGRRAAADAQVQHDDPAFGDWRLWLLAVERGTLAGVAVYGAAVVAEITTPIALMNPPAVAWGMAAASLAWAGYASRSLFSRI